MIKYMLDTNICIYLIKRKPQKIVDKFNHYRRGEICISSITWAELCCGIKKDGSNVEQLLEHLKVAPFGISEGKIYGKLSELFPNRKSTLDRMIASHALSLNATLVTNNISDFEFYMSEGLILENWITES